ncbi:MAG: outer membrane beta-barrel protein [Holophagales bacterium]|jgi:hypothetical protein|nr:outer membrane beta-barrel protein [Holophagales bacterium]
MKKTTAGRGSPPLVTLALLLAGGSALSSQGTPKPKPSFGLYVSGAKPMGDWADLVGFGFGAGGFWQTPFKAEKLSGRVSADYILYSGKDYFGITTKSNQMGASFDALYDLSGQFYVFSGVGFYRTEETVTIKFLDMSFSESSSDSDVGIGVGAGMKFVKQFGLEAKYLAINNASRLQVSLLWRF